MTPPDSGSDSDCGDGGPLRSLPALAALLTRAWWPQVAALAAAAAVVTATITGGLGVGSALRRGLRDLALERLGGIEAAVVSDDFFRADLATELAAGLDRAAGELVPAIVTEASIEAARAGSGSADRVPVRATLLACDDPGRLGFAAAAPLAGDAVLVNATLASTMAAEGTSVATGDEIVVRLPPRSAVPADSPLGRRGGLAEGRRLRVAGVIPDAGLGRFSLVPAAATRPLVVLPLAAGQQLCGRAGGANVLFAATRGPSAASAPDDARIAATLRARLEPRLEDLGLALGPVADGRALRLTSRRLILPPEVDRAAAEVLGPHGGRPTLAFLATALVPRAEDAAAVSGGSRSFNLLEQRSGERIRQVEKPAATWGQDRDTSDGVATASGGSRSFNLLEQRSGERIRQVEKPAATSGTGGTVEVPYSTVLGIDATALPVGDLVDDDGRPLVVPADDEIVIGRWMADDLAAQGRPVAVGDRITVRFFEPETLHGRVAEAEIDLRISGIAAMRGAAVARELVPEVEGVTDEASIADWDPPFPFDRSRIRAAPPHDEDERYWKAHGAAPKAFTSLGTARRVAGGRFGATTAWLVPTEPGNAAALAADLGPRLAAAIDPAAVGVRIVPLGADALAAARGSTPFGGLFLALSSFVMVAGLILEWLLFGLLVAARRRDVGILAAVGWAPARIARLLLTVGGIAAVGGAAVGAAVGPAWARALLAGLATAWEGGVESGAAAAFARWPAVADIWHGAAAAALVSLAALAWAARRAARLPPASLLAGRDDPGGATGRAGGVRPLLVSAALLAAAVGCGLAGREADAAAAVGLFFAAGAAALGGFLAAAWWWLARRAGGAARTLPRLARRGLAHRRGRAFAIAAIVAVAEFLVVAVSAFRLDASPRPGDRGSPTGGWTHVASFAAPTAVDPTDPDVRADLGLDSRQDRVLAACDVALVRSSGGADASCTSLYDAAGRATILGVGPGFVSRGGFRFTAAARPVANPWTLLDRPEGAVGPVPAILDAATAQWALKLGGVGSRFTLPDDAGRPVEFEIVGLLDLSILQGFVLVAEREFERIFAGRSGYGMALVDSGGALEAGASPAEALRAVAAAWADAAPEVTLATDRIARLQAVQNTFLAAFQALGTLGLLLGTAGVAAVQAQGVAERRGQLALLRAVGFTPARLRGLLALETAWTVGLGLAAGAAAGLVAVAPLLRGARRGLPLAWILATSGLVLAVALAASAIAASRHAIPERPAAD